MESKSIHCTSTLIYHSVSSHQTELQRSATSCKVLRSSEPKFSNLCNLELAHRIYYQYYSVDRIFCDSAVVYASCLIC